jgi:hypothetical protein
VKGNMQLFSVEQQRSQALEAHAAVFGTLKARDTRASPPPSRLSRMRCRAAMRLCDVPVRAN